jgi:hypothetical protein
MNNRIIIYLKMRQNKGHTGALNHRTFLYAFLLLFLGLINPWLPELRSNVQPEILVAKVYPVDILKAESSNFRNLSVNRDVPVEPLTKNNSANNARPQPLSDKCFYNVGHRAIADKAPEPALLAFSGVSAGYPLSATCFVSHLSFVIFSSWTGNCIKIRPPPLL